jgi:hypothetical protein
MEHHDGWRPRALLAAGAAYALGAAATTAFTLPGDVMTALPIVTLAVLVVARWPLHPRPPELAPEARGTHPYRAWGALLAVIVAWELAQYLARGSRGAHPTLSSMADALDRHYVLKAVVFFGWLSLGALIVSKGTQTRAPSGAPAETP